MTTTPDVTDSISQVGTVIGSAATDAAFRSALLQSPAAALQSAGIAIPEGMTVEAAENSDTVRNLVVFASGEMSAEDQQQLAAMLGQASAPSSELDAWAKLVLDSWNDSALQAQLQTDPAAAFAQRGIALPSGISLRTLTASDSVAYAVVPPSVAASSTDSSGMTIGDMAESITDSFTDLTKLITAASYLAGLAFSIGATMKFKQHKDNPTQIPIGTPIALVFIAAALLFLSSILDARSGA